MSKTMRWIQWGTAATALCAMSACGGSTEASGEEASTIKVGVIAPLTGPASALGPLADGVKAYFDVVNQDGGINGSEVEVIVKDDAYDPSKTPGQARALVEDEGVDVMCGPVGTGPTSAIYSYLTQQNVPTLALTGSPEFAGPDSTVFEQLPDYMNLGAHLADFAVNDLKAAGVAIAYSPDGVGEPFMEGAKAHLDELGVTPTLVEFDPTSPDQSTVASKLKASGAEVVMVNHVAPIVSSIAKAAVQQGYKPQYLSTFAVVDAKFGELTGGSLDGIYVATPFLIGSESEAKEYREAISAYDDSLNVEDPVIMEGWATADVCNAALQTAADEAGGKPSKDDIRAAMENLTVDTEYINELAWTPEDHTGQKSAQIIEFAKDKFVPARPFAPFPGA